MVRAKCDELWKPLRPGALTDERVKQLQAEIRLCQQKMSIPEAGFFLQNETEGFRPQQGFIRHTVRLEQFVERLRPPAGPGGEGGAAPTDPAKGQKCEERVEGARALNDDDLTSHHAIMDA